MKKEHVKPLTGMIILAAIVLLGALVLYRGNTGPGEALKTCDINNGECLVSGVLLTVEPTPLTAMRETVFRVMLQHTVTVPEDTSLALHLFMPGMDMGTNRFKLQPIGQRVYSGRVVVPRCPSGKKLWRAVVLNYGAQELAEFYFEVQ